jgi:hypothetical protein
VRLIDLTGKTFNRLRVLGRHPVRRGVDVYWNCICVCGRHTVVRGAALRSGTTGSCGCLHREIAARVGDRSRTHGMSGTTEHIIWTGMIGRCTNPHDHAYANYGGRGITVCPRWMKFENFLADMGKRPSRRHSLDRKENDKGYSLSNCRWATSTEQAQNRRSAHIIEFRGEQLLLTEWARRLGIRATTLLDRIQCGWPLEFALTHGRTNGAGWKATVNKRVPVACTVCRRVLISDLRGHPSRHAPPNQLNTGNGLRVTCAGVHVPGVAS